MIDGEKDIKPWRLDALPKELARTFSSVERPSLNLPDFRFELKVCVEESRLERGGVLLC